MPPEKPTRAKRHLNVGTIGHIAHGKTTLTAAIVKAQAKKGLAREITYADIARGGTVRDATRIITLSAAHVEYESPRRHYAHVDCPGDARYVKNMIIGAAQMDGAILVVSVLDSVMPQTREHLLLARQMGVQRVVVFLNKCDANSDPEIEEVAESEVRELLSQRGFDGKGTPVIHGAALPALQGEARWEAKIDELLDALDSHIPEPVREAGQPFLMTIDSVVCGVVATGRIERGLPDESAPIEIVGLDDQSLRPQGYLRVFDRPASECMPGDRITCLVHGTGKGELKRGQVLAKPGTITPHKKFSCEVYVLKKEEGGRHTPFFTNYRPQFHIGTADVTGACTLPEGTKMVMPGDTKRLTVELITPVALEEQGRFALREGGKTIGVGVVTALLD